MATTKKVEEILVKPVEVRKINVRIVGDSPLIIHAWSEKAKRMLIGETVLDKDPLPKKKKEARDPWYDFINAVTSGKYQEQPGYNGQGGQYDPKKMTDRVLRNHLCDSAGVKECDECRICNYWIEFADRIKKGEWKYECDYKGKFVRYARSIRVTHF